MHKSKKKTKTAKIPQPIKVKKEKTEEERTLQPMSHFIDDRLELVKQIFGSLKPKTITNLAPDFLKKMAMEEIEELCLHELLCISTKRLLSIMNASKCPTDTESDNDSDVERQDEHISLEEISSDSEIEGASSSKAKKKKRPGDVSSSSAGAKKIATKNPAEKNAKDGPMSVLELLELQARARAIRSQLALEPVTKIEVDSDDENDEASQKSSKNTKSSRGERKRKSSDKERQEAVKSSSTSNASSNKQPHSKSNGSTEPKTSTSNAENETSKRTGRKIKLKRDYSASVQEKNDIEAGIAVVRTEPIVEATPANEVKNGTAPSRSPSPDVIPIITETETLLISDSSDMEQEGVVASKATIKPVDKNQLVVKVNASHERLVTKPGQPDKPKNERQMIEKQQPEKPQTEQPPEENKEEGKRVRKITEPEEGELSESETNDKSDSANELNTTNEEVVEKTTQVVSSNVTKDAIDENQAKECVNDNKKAEEAVDTTTKPVEAPENEDSSSSSSSSESETETREKADIQKEPNNSPKIIAKTVEIISNIVVEQASTSTAAESSNAVTTTPEEYDDQNDDVISLEGGDLENEMIEHLEAEKKAEAEKKVIPKPEPRDEDIISLDSSGDEAKASWHSRYLKSSKVNKVLLTSRLGKRVRDNIRKSKRSKKDSMRDAAAAAAAKEAAAKAANSSVFTSQHEDGSVEQYKELQEMRQRKSKE